MKVKSMQLELRKALAAWDSCIPEIKEKAGLFMETWVIPNIKYCLKELEEYGK